MALHVTVADTRGEFVADLKSGNFRVFENKIEQKISLFSRDDVPVTMGLVVDNSASMRAKRAQVNAAAMTFVRTSNPQDEAFVVNFNDEYYLDTDGDFTSDQKNMNDALAHIDTRGSTALYDALIGSLDHLKKGHKDKRVLLVVTDGVDNASRESFEDTIKIAEQSNAAIYTIGVFSDEDRRTEKSDVRKARRDLKALAEATGGRSVFPGHARGGHAHLRAGGQGNSQSIHAGILPNERRQGRNVPRSQGGSDSAERIRPAVGSHARRILRPESFGGGLALPSRSGTTTLEIGIGGLDVHSC